MSSIIVFSGPCGCGKSTLTDAFARLRVRRTGNPVYVIHGDDISGCLVEPEDTGDLFQADGRIADPRRWDNIVRFNWDCILLLAGRAAQEGLDVAIDYVVEEELPRLRTLAAEVGAKLYYIVLTASAEALEQRIKARGDVDMLGRALFLKQKLDALPENQGHLFDNTGLSAEEEAGKLDLERFIVRA